MAQTAIDVTEMSGRYPTSGDEVVFVAGDVANGGKFHLTGRELILVRNVSEDTDADFTITSTPDSLGRTGDLVDTIPFGTQQAYMIGVKGWKQDNGQVYVAFETVDLEIAVLRIPS